MLGYAKKSGAGYSCYKSSERKKKVRYNVSVLQQSAWVLLKVYEIIIPKTVYQCYSAVQ